MGTGLGLLVLYAATEVLANPGLTLADGYWIGRLPWTAIGIALAVLGATGVIIFGTVSAWLAGGAIGRVITGLAATVAAFWWFLAVLPPPKGAYCADCPPPGPDPLAYAYSLPELGAALLLVPAAIVAALALGETSKPT